MSVKLVKEQELKRCPFCGSTVMKSENIMGGLVMYQCRNWKECGATVSFDNPIANHNQRTTDRFWNRRKGEWTH